MRVVVNLPDLYTTFSGKHKKKMAWAYLQRYYPGYVPIKNQDRLENDNVLICDIDFNAVRRHTAEVNERRADLRQSKGGKKK